LHGLLRTEAMQKIDAALKEADRGTYQIRLIHGYHRGSSLRTMIREEYRYCSSILRIIPGENEGITIFVLREM
ncbi:MAG: Smr/MutS family protein, partial [Parasporobacterium sp.]|nr:Smr/MutS family protein [Parasporobacterium sp.]